MSFVTDMRTVSETAVEQLSARFSDLPRPLLAAIGAGDLAVARLAALRESMIDQLGDGADVDRLIGQSVDLPAKAQQAASDVAESIGDFAAQIPAKAQQLVAELPGRVAEIGQLTDNLSADAVRDTVEAYTQLVGTIYGSLAARGDKTWSRVRSARPGTVVDAADEAATDAAPGAKQAAAAAKETAKTPATDQAPTAEKPPAKRPAQPRRPRSSATAGATTKARSSAGKTSRTTTPASARSAKAATNASRAKAKAGPDGADS